MYNGAGGGRQAKEDELISHMKASASAGTQRKKANLDDLFSDGSPHNRNNAARSDASPTGAAAGAADAGVGSSGAERQYGAAAQEASENLRRALRISESTNTTGYSTMQSLGKQRETIQNSLNTVDTTHHNLQESRQTIRDIRFQVYKEWFIKGCVIAALVALIVLIFWVKFLRKR